VPLKDNKSPEVADDGPETTLSTVLVFVGPISDALEYIF
jgi:hypothetical protein